MVIQFTHSYLTFYWWTNNHLIENKWFPNGLIDWNSFMRIILMFNNISLLQTNAHRVHSVSPLFFGIWRKPCRDECGFFTFPVAFKIISIKFSNRKLAPRWAQILIKIFQCLQFVKMWRKRNNFNHFFPILYIQTPQTLE